jgi:hypothetical protein
VITGIREAATCVWRNEIRSAMQTNLCPGRLNLVSEVVVADRNENLIGNNPVTDAFLSG